MDPLHDVLALLEVRAHLSASLTAGGDWAVRFDAPSGAEFNAVRRGSCRLEVEGAGQPLDLAEGDCYLLTGPYPSTLGSGSDIAPVPAAPLLAAAGNGTARAGRGEETLLVGGRFSFGPRARELLLDRLPPVIHIPAGAPHARTVGRVLAAIEQELAERPMASALVAEHLAVVMLVHALRLHLARAPHTVSGWMAGLADPVTAAALTALHEDPAHPWTVAELAGVCAVSRSTLAARFKNAVGRGPLEYLTHWRIELTARRLRDTDATLAAIARDVGYGSESALSVAFKRVTGLPPGDYRRRPAAPDSRRPDGPGSPPRPHTSPVR
ncbi:AraC family transcriptional regulator [Streptomyces sp. NBC_00525]|uniref:AraC family transcriptional regulator n=1 Tax=Streptomyces sp. NBC_00525 TaxID=2903660 RepID=UPI002E7FEB46|nr:AraC family transcriptional regulator [Streptomyces sp. NBC_00525]WUC92263.1 AraC family transcriptional regulator [Streptomyces sp. NBC_00525]